MRSMLVTWLVLLGIAGGCNGESTSADADAGAAGEPSAGGDGGTTPGTGGDVSTGGSGPAGGASSGGSPNGGTSNGGGPTGGTGAGGAATGCTPQDAAFVGACEPLPRKVFTGVECVEMLGCSCVGDDCDATYGAASDPPDRIVTCESAHAHCAGMARSCAELRAVYEEYASRDACQEDSDCRLTFGHCGIGIGGCHYFMNRQWPEEGLDSLAAEFQAESCTGPICDCATPPASVECVDGRCVAGP